MDADYKPIYSFTPMNPFAVATDNRQHTRPNTRIDITPDIIDVVRMSLGQYLKKQRSQRTMRQVADAIGCDISYLSKIENDHVVPPWDMLEKMADYYDLDESTLPALAWKQLEVSKQQQLNLAIAFWSAAS